MLTRGKLLILMTFVLCIVTTAIAEVKTEWRGENRDGKYSDTGLLRKWPANGPRLLWSVENLGDGFSSAAVTSARIYVTGMIDGMGYVFSFTKNGKLLWKKAYGSEWKKSYPGSRTTPTIVDNELYVVSAFGRVVCLNATTGQENWAMDMRKRFGAEVLKWGITESVLIDGNRLICTPGGRKIVMAALDRKTGKTIWACQGNGDNSSYCSPVLVNHGKRRLILTMTQKSIIGVDADNGILLWTHRHITDWDVNPNTPTYIDGHIYCQSGYGTGSVLLKLNTDGSKVSEVWRNDELDSQFGASVVVDGYIYGAGHKNRGWKCLDWKTGKLMYSSREFGRKGNVIFADGMLYLYDENGTVGLAKPNPNAFTVISSFEIPKGDAQHWAHPVIADKKLYIRHGNALMVYSLTE